LNQRTRLLQRVRPLWRLSRLALLLLVGAVLGAGTSILGLLGVQRPWLPRLVVWWHGQLCASLGIEVRRLGEIPLGGGLLVCNHVSWLDIPVLGGLVQARFVSKAEVRGWPLIGWLAGLAGTVFLRRGAHQAGSIAADIKALIESGELVALFPEGTTGDGRELRRFYARLFSSVEGGQGAICPAAIRYGRGPEPDRIAPFIGDDTLMAHLWRVAKHPHLVVQVRFLEPIPVNATDRRGLAEQARTAIQSAMTLGSDSATTGARGRPDLSSRNDRTAA
jgi:1-acyl-sn-glycerol-3-phosphate acyltransferase